MAVRKSRLVAAITRTSARMRRVPPTRSNSCSYKTRRKAIWAGNSPTSSRKSQHLLVQTYPSAAEWRP
jgi:hypothetical protein